MIFTQWWSLFCASFSGQMFSNKSKRIVLCIQLRVKWCYELKKNQIWPQCKYYYFDSPTNYISSTLMYPILLRYLCIFCNNRHAKLVFFALFKPLNFAVIFLSIHTFIHPLLFVYVFSKLFYFLGIFTFRLIVLLNMDCICYV